MTPGLDGSCPLGPALVSPSAIADPHKLRIKAIHNGNVVQDSSTRCVMSFPPDFSYCNIYANNFASSE